MEKVPDFCKRVGYPDASSTLADNDFEYAAELIDFSETELKEDYNLPPQEATALFNALQEMKQTDVYEVVQLLKTANISQCLKNILTAGVNSFDALCKLSEQEFTKCGIKNAQHRKTLLKAIEEMKQVKKAGSQSISAMYDNAFQRLKATLAEVVERAKVLSDFVLKLQLIDKQIVNLLNVNSSKQHVKNGSFSMKQQMSHKVMQQLYVKTTKHPIISVFGDVKAGKSTFINCILGNKFVASDFKPCTSMISVLSYADKPQVNRFTKNGEMDVVTLTDCQEIPTSLLSIEGENRQQELQYSRLEIKLNVEILKYVNIVDTPGLNEKGELDKHVFEYITQSDALIFVINASSTITNSLIELIDYVRKQFSERDLPIPRIFVLVNKIDALSEDISKDAVLDYISRQFRVLFPELKKYHPSEYIHGISASKALNCLLRKEKPPKDFGTAFDEIIKFFTYVSRDKMNHAFSIINSFYNKLHFTVDGIHSMQSLNESQKSEKMKPILDELKNLQSKLSDARFHSKTIVDRLESQLKDKLKEVWNSKEFLYDLKQQNFDAKDAEDTNKKRSHLIAEYMSNYIDTISKTTLKPYFIEASKKIQHLFQTEQFESSIDNAMSSVIKILKNNQTKMSVSAANETRVVQVFANKNFHQFSLMASIESATVKGSNIEVLALAGGVIIGLVPIVAYGLVKIFFGKEFSVEENIVREYSSQNSINFQVNQLMKEFKSQVEAIGQQISDEINDAINICKRIKNLKVVNEEVLKDLKLADQMHPSVVELIISDSFIEYNSIKITGPVGAGAFSTVMAGSINGEEVAVKQVNGPKRDVVKEAYALSCSSLNHDNIVQYIGYTQGPNNAYCIITKLYKTSLRAVMQNLDFEAKEKILHQIVEGLNHLHHHGMIHRDVKPDNILLTEDLVVKIADFGLAKNSDVATTICGTPGYIAPEISKYFGTSKYASVYTTKADVYSFGVMAFEMLCNQKYDTEAEWPTNIKDTLNTKIFTFLNRCREEDPSMRPTFSEVLQAFDQVYATDANGNSTKSIGAQLSQQGLSPASPNTCCQTHTILCFKIQSRAYV